MIDLHKIQEMLKTWYTVKSNSENQVEHGDRNNQQDRLCFTIQAPRCTPTFTH